MPDKASTDVQSTMFVVGEDGHRVPKGDQAKGKNVNVKLFGHISTRNTEGAIHME